MTKFKSLANLGEVYAQPISTIARGVTERIRQVHALVSPRSPIGFSSVGNTNHCHNKPVIFD